MILFSAIQNIDKTRGKKKKKKSQVLQTSIVGTYWLFKKQTASRADKVHDVHMYEKEIGKNWEVKKLFSR